MFIKNERRVMSSEGVFALNKRRDMFSEGNADHPVEPLQICSNGRLRTLFKSELAGPSVEVFDLDFFLKPMFLRETQRRLQGSPGIVIAKDNFELMTSEHCEGRRALR
jgi:hypothetical protein